METTLKPMPKPKGRPPKDTKTESVRIGVDIADLARVVAAHRKVEMSEYLSGLLRPLVQRDHKKAAREMLGGGEASE